MTQPAVPAPEWRSTVPDAFQRFLKEFEVLADKALNNGHPYHSVRITGHDFIQANPHTGRLPGWAIAVTTELGWEYENTTSLGDGDMWLLFKNPYIFS